MEVEWKFYIVLPSYRIMTIQDVIIFKCTRFSRTIFTMKFSFW